MSAPFIKRPHDAWAQWIGPEALISQVRGTAPFLEPRLPTTEPGRLIDLGDSPDGFLRILANWEKILHPNLNPEKQLQDYFALCLTCHHATVATFVPTDVDTKIRASSGANLATQMYCDRCCACRLPRAPGLKTASRPRHPRRYQKVQGQQGYYRADRRYPIARDVRPF